MENHKIISDKYFVDIMVACKDRPTELALLLQSLRTQTFQEFDIYLLDDGSGVPITNFHFLQCVIQRLKLEGHKVRIIRNNIPGGVAKARQYLVDFVKKEGIGNLMCRLDDDVIAEPDYLEKLIEVIETGYDLASGVTPPMMHPQIKRSTRFVKPVINRIVLTEEGEFVINGDDCGSEYLEEEIIPTDHFRSCALYKKEIHDAVEYETTLTKSGMREEEFLSLRAILAGFKLGVHTGARVLHLLTPSGGQRFQDHNQLMYQNEVMLNRFVRKKVKKHGNFIEDYHKKLEIKETEEDKLRNLYKQSNFIVTKEV